MGAGRRRGGTSELEDAKAFQEVEKDCQEKRTDGRFFFLSNGLGNLKKKKKKSHRGGG